MKPSPAKPRKDRRQFTCPQCSGSDYARVTARDVFGQDRETGVYECTHCHFGFAYPERYALPQSRRGRL